jgi:uroporphyrinogen decarboxylase
MHDELTPDILLETDDFFTSPRFPEDYRRLADRFAYHKAKGRFCYVQTPGFFEHFNGVFGIENHLMYLALYPEELAELYRRQADWTIEFAGCCIDLGIDMIHLSDDWGSQRDMLFSPSVWKELIYPNLKRVIDYVHSRGALVSLHSDGCVKKVCDELASLGLDVLHPWQESAGMSYDLYLERYADRFAILGGICIQTALGLMPREQLEEEIRRVFRILRGRRWICCTTHFVQAHCSIEDLTFAYDLIYRLARGEENP